MTKKEKPRVGQILYSLNVNNAARNCEQVLTPMIVTKVSRKYFHATEHVDENGNAKFEHLEVRFLIENWEQKTDYCAGHKLFDSEKTGKDFLRMQRLSLKFSNFFSFRGAMKLSLDQAEVINQYIEEAEEK